VFAYSLKEREEEKNVKKKKRLKTLNRCFHSKASEYDSTQTPDAKQEEV
jgi:hypothetical protein